MEACLRGGRTGLYIGKADAIFDLAEVGDGAEVRAVAATATARRACMGIGIFDGDVGGAILSGVDAQGDVGDQIEQMGGPRGVDFIPGVGGLVIVAVETGEKEKDGNAFRNEGSVIAGGVSSREFSYLKVVLDSA